MSNTVELGVYVFETKLGWMMSCWRDGLLYRFSFGHPTRTAAERSFPTRTADYTETGKSARQFAERMRAFSEGEPDTFLDLELDLTEFTTFQRRVLEECRRIPLGTTMSYGELAKRVGRPGAARAVGTTMKGNRFPLIIPCHRVVGSSGKLGGYSGARGLETKRTLLKREGVLSFTGP